MPKKKVKAPVAAEAAPADMDAGTAEAKPAKKRRAKTPKSGAAEE